MAVEEKDSKNEFIRQRSEGNNDESLPEMELTPIHITVTVESLENLDFCKINEIMIKMEYMNEVIAVSEKIEVKNREVDVDLSGHIITDDISPEFMDDLLSNPVLIKVLDLSINEAISPIPASQERGSKMKVTRSKFTIESKTKANVQPHVGICNLDIGGFLNGKKSIRETLFLESEKKIPADELVSWVKLPRLIVVASLEEGEEFPLKSLDNLDNIVGITVESIYHIPHNLIEATNFEAVIPFPRSKNKNNTLSFCSGKHSILKDPKSKKKWATLCHMDGPGCKSKYSLSDEEIISPFNKLNLRTVMNECENKVQWNVLNRFALSKDDLDLIYSKMMKYRVWPVEIFCETRKPVLRKTPKGNGQDSKKSKTVLSGTSQGHFIAFLNISSLLYPGVRKARVAGQLYTYSQSEVSKRFDADFFPSFAAAPPVVETVTKVKTAGDKNKTSAIEMEEKKDDSGMPLMNEYGFPVFIVVEFELLEPFIPRRSLESLDEQLQTYISLKEKISNKSITYEIAKTNFSYSIEDIVAAISEEYEIFAAKNELETIDSENALDKSTIFYEFLRSRESLTKIATTLESKILAFVNAKFGKLSENNDNLPEIYISLVEEMHQITYNKIMPCLTFDNSYCNQQDMQLYAEEAFEEDEFLLSRDYLLLKIAADKTNPNSWLDYALFCFVMNDFDTALEASKEALSLDMHHQMGLLIYGVISTTMKDITAAELAFQVLITKYPDFVEAWSVLQLLYLSVGNLEASDIAMQTGLNLNFKQTKENEKNCEKIDSEDNQFNEKCNKSQNHSAKAEIKYGVASFVQGMCWSDSLSWTTQLCPKNELNFRVGVLLLKLGFLEYASMALSEQLMMPEGNILCCHYQYYLAVICYLQGFYKNAICHLELAIKEQGKNSYLWGLMGHCYYKMDDYANAIECFEFVLDSSNRPDDIHLVYMRMGSYYLKAKKFYCAKKIFATACKYSPSPRVWKGVGIACLRMGELNEAELALSEANYLDNRDAETWGYLALVNGLLGRPEILRYCFLESKKKKLNNQSLAEEILSMMGSNFED